MKEKHFILFLNKKYRKTRDLMCVSLQSTESLLKWKTVNFPLISLTEVVTVNMYGKTTVNKTAYRMHTNRIIIYLMLSLTLIIKGKNNTMSNLFHPLSLHVDIKKEE